MQALKLLLSSRYLDPPVPLKNIRINTPCPAISALLTLCLTILFSACNESGKDQRTAFLGGEIINPTSNQIIIKRNGKILDTIPLNDKNRFSYKIDSVEKGLYLLEYQPETQNIYLSPGDSLLLRANTLAFDESLHFSGKGFEKNNLMAEMFLEDENTAKLLLNFYKYTPQQFSRIADSIKVERLKLLERSDENQNFTEDFIELSKDIIEYENRDLRERYTYLVTKYYKQYGKQIPEEFHAYREHVDFNNKELQCSPGYKRFIQNYLINYSLSWCAGSGLDKEDCYDLTNVHNVNARLRKAGELIQLPFLREYILRKIAVRGIVMANSRENIVSILKALQEQNFSEKNLDEMRKLGSIQLAFLPGISLGEVSVVNMEGELLKISELLDKPTVIFIWSAFAKGHEEEHRRIRQLRQKYPGINFIGINIDVGDEPEWRVAVRKNNYDTDFEYQLGPTRIENKFYSFYIDKLLFLDPSGEVLKGDAVLTNPNFETQLLEFLNR